MLIEQQYLELLKDVLHNGRERTTRNATTLSLFHKNLSFDLRDGFPLLTTKKIFWKGVVEELLFFLRGDTQTKILEDKGVNIWKGNTSREFLDSMKFFDRDEGDMGEMYGKIWKNHNQLDRIIHDIKCDPNSRRLVMTTLDLNVVDQGVLWPCHGLFSQFYVEDGFLDLIYVIRSSDLFLGLPFNIASTSLFLSIIARKCNLIPRFCHMTLGDCHIYKDHIQAVQEQLSRIPYNLPRLLPFPDKKFDSYELDDFKIDNYKCHPAIKAKMIA